MSNDKMRDEFDSWIEKQGMSTMKDGETYYHRVTHVAWQAWKASRAAPAVQGKPLGYVVPRMAARLGEGELCGISVLDQPEDGHTLPVYLGPQPAEQQPELAKYQPCGCVICTCEHETQCQGCGGHHCGTHHVGQFSNPVYQQPSPDVAGLVEALESACEQLPKGSLALQLAVAAITAYRKGGEA